MADHDKPVKEWLLGDLTSTGDLGPNGNGAVKGSPGVLERLFEWYPGDPTGPLRVLTLAAAALGLAPPDGANSCTLTVEGAAVRFAADGQPATATRGLLLPAGTVMSIGGVPSLRSASFFTVTAGGIVQAQFWT